MLDYLLFPLIALLAAILLLAGFVILNRIRQRPGVKNLILLLVSIVGWLVFNTLELVDPTESGTLLWAKVTYIFIASTPVLWLIFILDYFGYTRFVRYPAALLYWLIPLAGLLMVSTNDTHHFFWSSTSFIPVGDYLGLRVKHGPGFYIFWLHAYLLLMSGILLVARESFYGPRLYRWQSGWIAAGGLVVFGFNIVYVTKLFPTLQKDYTPVALAIGVLCFLIAITRYQLFQVVLVRKAVLFDALEDGVIVIDGSQTVVSINTSAQGLLGIDENQAIGQRIAELLPHVAGLESLVRQPGDEWHDTWLPSRPGHTISIKINPVASSFQRITGSMMLLRDTTRDHQMRLAEKDERQFAQALSEIAAALNSTRNLDELLTLIINNVRQVTSCDSANIMLIENGFAHAVRSLEPLKDWVHIPIEKTSNMKWMVEHRQPMVMPDVDDFPEWLKIPETHWIRSYVGAPIVTKDQVIGFINLDSATSGFYNQKTAERLMAFAYHVSIAMQNARLYQQLQELATTDDLTGLKNRRHFFDLALREFSAASRYQRPLTAVMLDLDFFKKVNDRYGHLVGDITLARVGRICQAEIREMDLPGRYGGEEFVLLLPETSLEQGCAVAERIREKIAREPFEFGGQFFQVTASLGVAELQPGCAALKDLLDRCDKALYQAKEHGRNQVVAYHPEQSGQVLPRQ